MRYFKCEKINTEEKEMLKAQYAKLCAKEQKRYRRAKLLHKLGTVVFAVVSLGAFVGAVFLISKIDHEEPMLFYIIMDFVVFVVLSIFALIVALLLGALVAAPLWSKAQKREKSMRQQFLHKACQTLREYYGFCEPFLVTKCYRCSDRKFDRHDVCLFVVEDELRITADLHNGFFHPDRDLGCYGLTRQEIALSPTQYKEHDALQLEADGVTFLLGTRAQKFIKEQFLKLYSDQREV